MCAKVEAVFVKLAQSEAERRANHNSRMTSRTHLCFEG